MFSTKTDGTKIQISKMLRISMRLNFNVDYKNRSYLGRGGAKDFSFFTMTSSTFLRLLLQVLILVRTTTFLPPLCYSTPSSHLLSSYYHVV